MNDGEGVAGLFAELRESGSLETALSRAVRLVCREAGYTAAAIQPDPDGNDAGRWVMHDPDGIMNSGERALVQYAQKRPIEGSDAVSSQWRRTCIPIICGRETVGNLVLITTEDDATRSAPERLAELTALIGVLLAAAESTACRHLSNVLSRSAFRARVSSELPRAQRSNEPFALLHAEFAGASAYESECGLWEPVAQLAEALSQRLRRSDVIGLTRPDRLTILLTGTGRVGALIAARRIETLMLELIRSSSTPSLYSDAPAMSFLVFPDNADAIERSCRPGNHSHPSSALFRDEEVAV